MRLSAGRRRRRRGGPVNGVVDDADAERIDAVAAPHDAIRVLRDAEHPIRAAQRRTLDAPDEGVSPLSGAPRELRRVDEGEQRLSGDFAGRETRRERHPVVNVDDVEVFLPRNHAGHGGETADLVAEIVAVEAAGRAIRDEPRPARDHPHGSEHGFRSRLGAIPGAAGPPGQKEHDLAAERSEAAHEAFARHAQASRDRGRKLPADHEDPHGRLRRDRVRHLAVTITWYRRFSCQQESLSWSQNGRSLP